MNVNASSSYNFTWRSFTWIARLIKSSKQSLSITDGETQMEDFVMDNAGVRDVLGALLNICDWAPLWKCQYASEGIFPLSILLGDHFEFLILIILDLITSNVRNSELLSLGFYDHNIFHDADSTWFLTLWLA